MDMNLIKLQKIVKERGAWHTEVHEVAKVGYDLAMNDSNNLLWFEYVHPEFICMVVFRNEVSKEMIKVQSSHRVGTCEKRHGQLWVPSPLRADRGRAKRGQGQKVARKQPFQ